MNSRPLSPSLLSRLRAAARTTPVGAFAAVLLLVIVLIAVFAPVLAPFDPLKGDYSAIRHAPTSRHWLGTDDLGRDVLSRIIYGARISLTVGVASVLIGDTIGLITGILTGYIGGKFDLISQRFLEVLLAFPGLILATMFVIALGAGLQTVIIAIAVTRIPASNRVVRSVVFSLKSMDFVTSARVAGASPLRIMARHLAPQTVAPFLVVASAHLGIAITSEAALSFLGIGVPPPTASWGTMLGSAMAGQFRPSWWLAIFPGVMIAITVFCANIAGDALRDLLDPNLKNKATGG